MSLLGLSLLHTLVWSRGEIETAIFIRNIISKEVQAISLKWLQLRFVKEQQSQSDEDGV